MWQDVFVGREDELTELDRLLDRGLEGHGGVGFVTGEAGTGKTALVGEFARRAQQAHDDLIVVMGSCNAQSGIGDPYLPFREILAQLTGDVSSRSLRQLTPETADRLETVFVRSVQVLVEVAPELVGLFVPGAKILGLAGKAIAHKAGWMDRLEELTHRSELADRAGAVVAEQNRIFEQYTAFIRQLSAEVPIVLFVDDLQWADTATVGLLFYLARRLETNRVLLLGAYRPTDVALGRPSAISGQVERHPLEAIVNELTRYYGDVSIELDRMPEVVSRQFLDDLLDTVPNHLDTDFRDALFHQTGGHALFTIELLSELQRRGDLVGNRHGEWVAGPDLDWDTLPAKVEGVIAERIGRLEEELQEMLTAASVEGERFTAEVLAEVQAMPARQVLRVLGSELHREHRLVNELGVRQIDRVRLSLYRFVHNLFRQYLYNSLGTGERAYLHRDVGEILEELLGDRTEEAAADLARHFEEADLPTKAAHYRLQAGNRARRMSAHTEAATHLTCGLELIKGMPDGSEKIQLELQLQAALGTVLIATHGYAAPEVEDTLCRARELARLVQDPVREMAVGQGLAAFRFVRAELGRAYAEGADLLKLAQDPAALPYRMSCELTMGAAALHSGDSGRARQHFESVLEYYQPEQHRDLVYYIGHDPAVGAMCHLSFALFHQGYPEQALAKKDAALELARTLDHQYTLGYATSFAASLLCKMRAWSEAQAQADAAVEIGQQGHYPAWLAIGTVARGYLRARLGDPEAGAAELTKGIAIWNRTGARLARPYNQTLLAEAWAVAGRRAEGLEALEESFCCPEEAWWLPEQYRVEAQLLALEPGTSGEVEATLRKALDAARQQQSKSLELRAAIDLAYLLQGEGRAAEGRDLLAACYGWFSEGFDTPDLKAARMLLDDLGVSVAILVGQSV